MAIMEYQLILSRYSRWMNPLSIRWNSNLYLWFERSYSVWLQNLILAIFVRSIRQLRRYRYGTIQDGDCIKNRKLKKICLLHVDVIENENFITNIRNLILLKIARLFKYVSSQSRQCWDYINLPCIYVSKVLID